MGRGIVRRVPHRSIGFAVIDLLRCNDLPMDLCCLLLILGSGLALLSELGATQRVSDPTTGISACPSGHFRCNNGACIPSWKRCDRAKDCTDASDEVACPAATQMCGEDEYTCRSGKCIPYEWSCDGRAECEDRDDEETAECDKDCRDGYFQCSKRQPDSDGRIGRRCIPYPWVCDRDHKPDCVDGEDEAEKACPLRTAHLTCQRLRQRMCANGECVSRSVWCNGEEDCADGSDEARCPTTAATISTRLQSTAVQTGAIAAGTTVSRALSRTMAIRTPAPLTVRPVAVLTEPVFPLQRVGLIVGLATAACLVVLMIGGCVFWLWQTKRSRADGTRKAELLDT